MEDVDVINWIKENKEWFFPALTIAVTVVGGIIKVLFFRNKPTQVQKSGKDSISIQTLGDVNIGDTKWMDKNKK